MRDDVGPNSFSGGLYSFFQNENDLFGLAINDQSYVANSVPNTTSLAKAGLVEFHIADHLRVGRYITLLGGDALLHLPQRVQRKRDLSAHRRNG